MARVKCRCGEVLEIPADASDRLKCDRCGAKIRIRRSPGPGPAAGDAAGDAASGDGYIRFACPCGRRLKVRAQDRPEAGKCPDCGRIVPVPESAYAAAGAGEASRPSSRGGGAGASSPEGPRTADMDAHDLEQLEEWARRFRERPAAPRPAAAAAPGLPSSPLSPPPISGVKMEAGLRVCSRCGKPLHMSATVCRSCGEPAPRRS
ncbi:Double zinc ribbon [Aquisphaera giovannonii]|uniref:Double zinc ribbon n=1 Tax=Aquisphaera giovannonii TaxID=406548 RepID=A0A5B9VUL8_9BACT|nr:hypothetical protein [Aquisphaera giovannonii]QEH31567.1 Double zinc ribbon [Aquisphaera giovannonii]